jgi:manganese/zinc/iron transport system permease protein
VNFFTDPVVRSSTLGSMLMCFSSAIVGVLVFIRKKSLVGETLSHASFPGVVISLWLASLFFPLNSDNTSLAIIIGAFFFAFLGLKVSDLMENKLHVSADNTLCFVLSSFFGLGILIASYLQQTKTLWYRQALVFLYGQAATMTDIHVAIYGYFALFVAAFIIYFYRYLQAVNFDPLFAQTVGIRSKKLDSFFFLLIVLTIVVGIRSVGVILISGMLIGPAIAARPLTKKLSSHFLIAAIFGTSSGFLGNYFSIKFSNHNHSFPTGPMILLISSTFCFLSLIFAPRNGLFIRYLKIRRFRFQCSIENTLKALWKKEKITPKSAIQKELTKKKLIDSSGLTLKGKAKAEKIVRFHRLWEVYLVDYLGQGAEKVHKTAEELEHLMSPDLEKKLTDLLQNPKYDPHHQPIPSESS